MMRVPFGFSVLASVVVDMIYCEKPRLCLITATWTLTFASVCFDNLCFDAGVVIGLLLCHFSGRLHVSNTVYGRLREYLITGVLGRYG